MRKFLLATIIAGSVLALSGCGSGADSSVDTPKGTAPTGVVSPPGTLTPEQKGLANEKAQGQVGGPAAKPAGPDQDGGGQDGK